MFGREVPRRAPTSPREAFPPRAVVAPGLASPPPCPLRCGGGCRRKGAAPLPPRPPSMAALRTASQVRLPAPCRGHPLKRRRARGHRGRPRSTRHRYRLRSRRSRRRGGGRGSCPRSSRRGRRRRSNSSNSRKRPGSRRQWQNWTRLTKSKAIVFLISKHSTYN